MSSIQRLSEATAETAFLGHAEYHSMAMSERLDSAMREVSIIIYHLFSLVSTPLQLFISIRNTDEVYQGRIGKKGARHDRTPIRRHCRVRARAEIV